ncbi:MAG TPA: TonB family protein [Opitutaceae bacterium]|nr:TonB family protein [Opitutaceae bacterium]
MRDDAELLRCYAEDRDEVAFAELVQRHVNLVHSVALRQVNGDAHLAADVTQLVFADLARKAAALAQHRVLAGWLFTSTRFAAAKAVRSEQRRRVREQEAQTMQELNGDTKTSLNWEKARPVIDAALGELGEPDREAILLRFFEGRDFASVGAKLHLSDNTARMRVERALEKLRAQLARRGVTSTSAALATVLANQAVVAAPVGLAASVTGAALAGGSAAGAAVGAGAWATFMSMTKLQIGIAGALAATGAAGLALQAQSNAELRTEVASLRQENAALAPLRAENLQLARTAAEVADLRRDDAELARLGEQAGALKTELQRVTRAEAQRAATTGTPSGEVLDISKLDRQPAVKVQAPPRYPFELRRAGIGGEVVVDFIVDTNGNVANAHAIKSSVANATKPDEVVRMSPLAAASDGVDTAGSGGGAALSEADIAKLFETAAVEAVSQWHFTAGQKSQRPVNTHLQVPIVFSLDQGSNAAAKK